MLIQMRKRIDRLLVERGLAETREKAQALIMAGVVLVNDQPVTKAGAPVSGDVEVRLKEPPHPYVGRGGLKIEGAVAAFALAVDGAVCVDVGSSTGGFTHFLLMKGAKHVYAVDVDVTQLDWRLRKDPKVTPVELNARFLEPSHIGEPADFLSIDASFISLTMLLPRVPAVLKAGGHCLVLVKPQFEVGREKVGKGGIVRNSDDQNAAIEKVTRSGLDAGLQFVDSVESPITGREGNREFFVLFRKP